MPSVTTPILSRKEEVVQQYLVELDKHIADLKQGKVTRALQIKDLAALVFLHPVHLSNTVKEVTGKSTCDLYEERMLRIAKELLVETNLPVGVIATQLTYDPSNFTKFFKHYTGITPKQFRNSQPKS